MNYYNEIKEQLIKSEIYDRANVIKQYAEKLIVEVGKKYNERTLYWMRKFFEVFSNEKLNPLGSKLSWSHYRELLTIKNIDEIMYYIDICWKNSLSKRQLQERIRNHEYDRLSDYTIN